MSLVAKIRFILTAALAVVATCVSAAGSTPQQTIKVTGLIDSVEIVRDQFGVAHIRAKNELDMHFGLGFAHAQDRLWQMEFQRRLGNGQLSEVLGASALPTDKLFRTLGLRRSAIAALAHFNASEKRPIEA